MMTTNGAGRNGSYHREPRSGYPLPTPAYNPYAYTASGWVFSEAPLANARGVYGTDRDGVRGKLLDYATNALLRRQEWVNRLLDPRRDIDAECGYPRALYSPQDYQDLADREPYAGRVVDVMAKESWQTQPEVYEKEEAGNPTPFEQALSDLAKSLRVTSGGKHQSYYQDDEGSPIWEALQRADVLSGIGHFGVVLMGLDDGEEDLSKPASFIVPGKGPKGGKLRKLTYLRVFPESMVQIPEFESDRSSPRYGQPVRYSVTFHDPQNATHQAGIGLTTETRDVHWTRILHVAECTGASEVFAPSRMDPVLNPLLDIKKVRGGSAEMYWRGALPGWTLETHPELGGDVEVDHDSVRDEMENLQNGLQRYATLMGMSAKSLAPQVVDPSPQILVQVQAICVKLGIPMRVFMGSERGELASSQDDQAWNDRLRFRQAYYLTPKIIVPFIDRLIHLGVLPEPEGYSVHWPDLTSQTAAEKAGVAATKTGALSAYVSGGGQSLIQPLDYLTRFLGMSEEEALMVLENSAKALEGDTGPSVPDAGGSPLLKLVGGITGMLEMFKLAKDGGLTREQLKQQIMLFYGVDDEKAEEIIADFEEPEDPPPAPPGGPPQGPPGQPPFGGPPASGPNPTPPSFPPKEEPDEEEEEPTGNQNWRSGFIWDYADVVPLTGRK